MKKILFVFNAHAGKATIGNYLLEIVSICNREGYAVTIMTTQHSGHATELVRDYGKDFDIILTSGGDGTVNEVVNGNLELVRPLPIAYIPTGTTNDYAASLGLPKNVSDCIDRIKNGNIVTADVGRLNGRAFVYIAAFGTLAKVPYTTSQDEKNTWGYPAYVFEVLKELPNRRAFHVRYTSGTRSGEGDYIFGFVTNSFSVSGFKGLTGRNVSLDDGLFEVTLIKDTGTVRDLARVMRSLTSEEPDPDYVEHFQTRGISFFCEEELEWCLDGEFGGRFTESNITVLDNAAQFYA